MASRDRYALKYTSDRTPEPFSSAEEAWFWFVAAQEARVDGARFSAGLGLIPRPCEPIDILKVLDQLYRNRRLLRDHLLVLRHYGRRRMPPDEKRVKEMRAHTLWSEAMNRMEEPLARKGIIIRNIFKRDERMSFDDLNMMCVGMAAE
jgi:hypothetical protein